MNKTLSSFTSVICLTATAHTAPVPEHSLLTDYPVFTSSFTTVLIVMIIALLIVHLRYRRTEKKIKREQQRLYQKEQALEQSEQRYRVVFENAAEGILIADVEQKKFLYANPAICKMFGYTEQEMTSLGVEDIHPADALEKVIHAFREQADGRMGTAPDLPCLRSDGTVFTADISAAGAVIDGRKCSIGFFTDTSARLRAAAALTESEAKFRNIVQSSPMGMLFYHLEPDGRLVFVGANPAADRLLGVDNTMYLGKTIEEAFPALTETEVPQRYREVARGGDTWYTEQIQYEDDNVSGAFEVYAFRTSPNYMAAAFLDVSERKRMETSLRESEESFRNLADNSPNMVFINQARRVVYANPLCAKILGYTIEQITSSDFNFMDLIADESRELVGGMFAKHMQGQDVPPYEYNLVTADGRKLTVINNSRLITFRGKPAILGVVTDITERKRMEEALRESEMRYRSFLQNFQGIAFRAELPGGEVSFFHGAVKQITGYTEADFKKNAPRWEEIILPEDFENIGDEWEKIATDPEYTTEREYRIRHKDGRIVWIHELVQNICEKPGVPTYIQGALYDVTDRKNAEDQIRASLREKETLLKEVHHRVKNNLQVISSLLSLQSQYVRDERDLEIFNDSRNRVRSMALIHEQLYRTDNFATVNFSNYITTIARELYRTYGTDPDRIVLKTDIKNVSIGLNQAIPCGLIVNELISNALKYAFPEQTGTGEITVTVTAGSSNDGKQTVRMTISDNGCGLPEDLNLDHSKSLGLYLVRLLTEEQLEGTLTIDRTGGTTFTVSFGVLDG